MNLIGHIAPTSYGRQSRQPHHATGYAEDKRTIVIDDKSVVNPQTCAIVRLDIEGVVVYAGRIDISEQERCPVSQS